jgi:hypothetical protein
VTRINKPAFGGLFLRHEAQLAIVMNDKTLTFRVTVIGGDRQRWSSLSGDTPTHRA